jgi:tetratricopeptide (TPR) repeat protein
MAGPTAKGRRRVGVGLAAALLLAAAVGAYLWSRPRPAAPPEIPLADLDPKVAEVLEETRAAILKDPRSGPAWARLGRALLANELHWDLSLVCFREAARLDPTDPRWPYFAGMSLVNLRRPEDALPELRRAVELGDREGEANPAPRLYLAETLLSLEQFEAAETQFREALAAGPQNPRAHFGLGMLAYSRGQWQACRTHLEACLGSPAARKKAAALLATVCGRLGDSAAAARYGDLAARFPKDHYWADRFTDEHWHLARRKRTRYRKVDELEAQGRFADAAEHVAALVADYPDDYVSHIMAGRILAQLGQLPRA